MPKIKVTPELAQYLKSLRTDNRIASKELALKIEKSPAYITKLEKGEIKNLDFQSLYEILSAIYSNDISKAEKEWNNIMEKYNDFISVGVEEKNRKVAELNFDTVYRKIPLPSKLSDYILEQVESLGMTISDLVQCINSNLPIKDIIDNNDVQEENNKWFLFNDEPIIIMNLNADDIDKMLHTEEATVNYVTIESMLLNIYILQGKSIDDAHSMAINKMTDFKFYSLREKYRAMSKARSKKERDELMDDNTIKNNLYVNRILKIVKLVSDYDIKYANAKLERFADNIDFDMGFTFAYLGIDLTPLRNLTVDKRKEFLKEIEKIVEKYSTAEQTNENVLLY